MLSKARQKIMEKLNRTQKCSISGPQNLGSMEVKYNLMFYFDQLMLLK